MDRLKEIIPFVVNENESGEVFHIDLPDRFHSEFRKIEHFNFSDVILGEDGCGATDGAELEATVFFA